MQELARHGGQADALAYALQQARKHRARGEDLVRVLGEARVAEEARAAAEEASRRHRCARDEARQTLETLLRQRSEAQAALLARDLKPGAPCPVCGATHHPHPAQAAGPLPETQAIQDAEERLASLKKLAAVGAASNNDVLEADRVLQQAITRLSDLAHDVPRAEAALAEINQRNQELIGQSATLLEAVVNGHSRIKIGDTSWPVRCETSLPAGSQVTILRIDGIHLLVAPRAQG